jgi:hypothetical protein
VRAGTGRTSADLGEPAGRDVEDETVDGNLPDPRMRPKTIDLGPNGFRDVGEGTKGDVQLLAGPLDQPGPDLGFGSPLEPAGGVPDHEDLIGPEKLLAHHDGADRVVGREATGVPDDVRVPGSQTERLLDVQARVHARDHRKARKRRSRQRGPIERLDVPPVLGKDPLVLGERRSCPASLLVRGHAAGAIPGTSPARRASLVTTTAQSAGPNRSESQDSSGVRWSVVEPSRTEADPGAPSTGAGTDGSSVNGISFGLPNRSPRASTAT